MRHRSFFLFLLVSFLIAPAAHAANYKVDTDHTSVSFKIRHLFSNVQGQFKTFEGSFDYDPAKPETWKVQGSIDTASIDTNVKERDNHLRSADFFDVQKFPKITFTSTKFTDVTSTGLPAGQAGAKMQGLLNLHGVEKPVVIDVEIHGVGKDPWGNVRSAFTGTLKLNRKDYGLTWNEVLETGQVLVGEEVAITLEVEGILQK